MSASPPTAPAAPLLSITGLTKVYGAGEAAVHALRGIDLELLRGEVVVLLGPSGSGKSTLLNILGGLDAATAGSVRFVGSATADAHTDICTLSPTDLTQYRRERVGFVFQFYNLIPSLTARENIEVVAELSPGALGADEVLALVGLGPRADHFPSELSGGEQQRVAIARALVKRPPLMLCDEPTGALDLNTGILTLQALLDANRRFGTTLLIVTHNADIARIADRVIHFADGSIRSITVNPERLDPAQLHW
ncbi:MAG: ABC transporter [Polaromonas sp.]|nr:ABC transporter [Polaromonas sp.]